MKRIALVLFLPGIGFNCWGQLQPGQKVQDFQALTSLYAKSYAPGHWKEQAFNYNLYKVAPWLTLVEESTDTLGFYEIMSEYVASLNDAHSVYENPSDFTADLGFSTDIYDGKVLIDGIDPSVIPAGKFSFQVGDEVVSVDGQTTDYYITEFSKYFSDANPSSTSRDAAGLIPFRVQAIDPRAESLGATATVVIKRQSGALQTYTVPWLKSGTPLTEIGPSPLPQDIKQRAKRTSVQKSPANRPPYRTPLLYLERMRLPRTKAVLNFDELPPVFTLPAGFVQRAGMSDLDFFFTGTYKSGGKTIGYIRIADFDPGDEFDAEDEFDTEIAYMEQNTDGLVVDVMRNPGGDVCYTEDLESRLMTHSFYDVNYELRPQIEDVQAYQESVPLAESFGEPDYVIQVLQSQANSVTKAYQQGGLTGPLPICQLSHTRPPNTDENGKLAVYSKPILLLTDLFSASAAELFSAMFQDAGRGKIFGTRTMGAGGTVLDGYPAGYYSEGFASVTDSLIIRQRAVVTADYPSAPLIENIGVRPEIESDYMTKANLLSGGKDFVNAFTAAILGMIQ